MTGVLVPTTSEAEWLAARRQGVTASEVATLMGLSPYSSPFELYHRKIGNLPEHTDNTATELGRYMEAYVAGMFTDRHPHFWVHGDGRQLYAHPERPWQMATPDRLVHEIPQYDQVADLLAVLECKIDAGDGFGDDGSDDIPVHYRCQALWQMDVLGVQTAFVACLLWHRREVRVYELTLDDDARADLAIMRAHAHIFLQRIENNDPPDVDWRPATTRALKTLHPEHDGSDVIIPRAMARRYRAAVAAYRKAEKRKKHMENQVRDRLGDGRRAVCGDGESVARRDVYDVREHIRKASHIDRLVEVPIKGAR